VTNKPVSQTRFSVVKLAIIKQLSNEKDINQPEIADRGI